MLNQLNTIDAKTTSKVIFTCHTVTNELNNNSDIDKEFVLDYILSSKQSNSIKIEDRRVIEVRGGEKESLSDHSFVRANIIFKWEKKL